jgi:hypothetical protein
MAGRKPISAPDASRPLPSALAMTTRPARTDVEQAGHAERRVAAQFERVAIAVVLAAQDDMHALQAAQGLQVDRVAAHRQVLPLDQRKAEVAGQVGVLEIGFVVRPGRQQHDVRRLAAHRPAPSALRPSSWSRKNRPGAGRAGRGTFRGRRARRPAGFPAHSRPRRRLRAVGDDPPAAVGERARSTA